VNEIDPIDAAWAAGFLDGEGHFGIREWLGSYQPSVHVTQVDPRPLLRLKALFGGGVRIGTLTYVGQRQHYRYYLTSRAGVASLIRAVLPYLSVKGEEATLLLQLIMCLGEPRPGKRLTRTTEETAQLRELHDGILALRSRSEKGA